jgi:autotransporter-associated beta strand protein
MAMAMGNTQSALAIWYWDGNGGAAGGPLGGSGPWDSTSLVWRTHPNNPLTNWVSGDTATFSDNAGTITLGTNIVISASMIDNVGMIVEGPFSLLYYGGTLTGLKTSTVNCAVTLMANAGFRNNYVFNGSISDDGTNRSIIHYFDTLTLNGSNSFGGGVSLMSGALVIGNDYAIGMGNLALGYDGAVLQAGGGFRTVTNRITWNWNWRLNFQGTNSLTCTATQTLSGTAAPYPRFNIVETNAVLTYGGLMRDTRYHTAMIKEGPGTFVIQGNYDASYGTVVTGGTLIVNGITTALQNNYGYKVWPGATLGGTGVINLAAAGSTCTVQQAGALAPGASAGASVGTLTITNGTVALGEGAIVKWDFKDGAGDRVNVKGTLVLPLVATVMVSRISGDWPATPTLFTANALTGPGAANVSGWVVQGVRGCTAQIQGNNVILQSELAGTLMLIR